jgi:hypothetical protein
MYSCQDFGCFWCLVPWTYFQTRVTTLESEFSIPSDTRYNPVIQIPTAISSYISLIFWPHPLSVFRTEKQFPVQLFLTRLAIFIGFTITLLVSWRTHRFLAFWLLLLPISLLPS